MGLIQLRVARKHWETPDTATFFLENTAGAPLLYAPGQYLPIVLEQFGSEKRRAYSFSSCPDVDMLPAITVRRAPNGEFSNYLLQQVEAGDVLHAAEPAGRFVLPDPLPGHLIYLAGGSGITPVMSHLKHLFRTGNAKPPRVLLLYANRDAVHTIFKNELDTLQRDFPDLFSLQYIFSRDKTAPEGLHGHLNQEQFERQMRQFFGGKIPKAVKKDTHAYLCAPHALMRMAEMTLRVLDFPEKQLHRENFVPDPRLPKRVLNTQKKHTVTVRGRYGDHSFEVYEGETILNGALRQGIQLPYTCKSGVCFSCLARCTRGAVDVAFVQQTLRQGPGELVNTCIGYALSERVELDYE